MNDSVKKGKYFHNLDALRFIAFLGVFFSHTLYWQASGKLLNTIMAVATLNYWGVPFFFTLSSFLITYNLLNEKMKYGDIHLLKFYINRGLRIWPIYFFLLVIYFFVLPQLASLLHIQAPTLAPIAPFLFFFVNFHIINYGGNFSLILLIFWSISIEEQFYLFWGMVFKWYRTNAFIYLLLFLFLFSIVFSYYYLYVLNQPKNNLSIHTFFVIQNFFSGAMLSWAYLEKPKLSQQFKKVASKYLSLVYVALPLFHLFLNRDMVLLNVIKSICFSLIICDQAFNPNRLFNLGKFSFINYMGKISYGLYLYHALVIILLARIFHFFDAAGQISFFKNILQISIALLITIAVSHLSYQNIELKFLSKKLKS